MARRSIISLSLPGLKESDNEHENDFCVGTEFPVQIRKPRTKNKTGSDRLHLAVWNDDLEAVRDLVLHKGVPVESWNVMGQTPLFVAAYRGQRSMTDELLSHGANPNVRCVGGYTAVHGACYSASRGVLTLILKYDGDMDIYDVDRRIPLDWAYFQPNERRRNRFLAFIESIRPIQVKKITSSLSTGLNPAALVSSTAAAALAPVTHERRRKKSKSFVESRMNSYDTVDRRLSPHRSLSRSSSLHRSSSHLFNNDATSKRISPPRGFSQFERVMSKPQPSYSFSRRFTDDERSVRVRDHSDFIYADRSLSEDTDYGGGDRMRSQRFKVPPKETVDTVAGDDFNSFRKQFSTQNLNTANNERPFTHPRLPAKETSKSVAEEDFTSFRRKFSRQNLSTAKNERPFTASSTSTKNNVASRSVLSMCFTKKDFDTVDIKKSTNAEKRATWFGGVKSLPASPAENKFHRAKETFESKIVQNSTTTKSAKSDGKSGSKTLLSSLEKEDPEFRAILDQRRKKLAASDPEIDKEESEVPKKISHESNLKKLSRAFSKTTSDLLKPLTKLSVGTQTPSGGFTGASTFGKPYFQSQTLKRATSDVAREDQIGLGGELRKRSQTLKRTVSDFPREVRNPDNRALPRTGSDLGRPSIKPASHFTEKKNRDDAVPHFVPLTAENPANPCSSPTVEFHSAQSYFESMPKQPTLPKTRLAFEGLPRVKLIDTKKSFKDVAKKEPSSRHEPPLLLTSTPRESSVRKRVNYQGSFVAVRNFNNDDTSQIENDFHSIESYSGKTSSPLATIAPVSLPQLPPIKSIATSKAHAATKTSDSGFAFPFDKRIKVPSTFQWGLLSPPPIQSPPDQSETLGGFHTADSSLIEQVQAQPRILNFNNEGETEIHWEADRMPSTAPVDVDVALEGEDWRSVASQMADNDSLQMGENESILSADLKPSEVEPTNWEDENQNPDWVEAPQNSETVDEFNTVQEFDDQVNNQANGADYVPPGYENYEPGFDPNDAERGVVAADDLNVARVQESVVDQREEGWETENANWADEAKNWDDHENEALGKTPEHEVHQENGQWEQTPSGDCLRTEADDNSIKELATSEIPLSAAEDEPAEEDYDTVLTDDDITAPEDLWAGDSLDWAVANTHEVVQDDNNDESQNENVFFSKEVDEKVLQTVWMDDIDSDEESQDYDDPGKEIAIVIDAPDDDSDAKTDRRINAVTEDLYCDDEFQTNLLNNPTMQLSVSRLNCPIDEAEQYPPTPMLEHKDSILTLDDVNSSGPSSLESDLAEVEKDTATLIDLKKLDSEDVKYQSDKTSKEDTTELTVPKVVVDRAPEETDKAADDVDS